MKSLIINTFACCTLLLPITQAQAAGAGSTFGGFTPNQTFTLTVTEVGSGKRVGSKGTKGVPIPAGIPKFKVNQTVKFTIGAKGQLIGPLFSIPYYEKAPSENMNSYYLPPVIGVKALIQGIVYKYTGTEKKGLPSGAIVTFFKFGKSKGKLTTNGVTYSFQAYND